MAYKTLVQATHWIDPDTGEEVKLSHNLKAVYHHRLDQYRSFSRLGKPYIESNQTIADKLGLTLDTVRKQIMPLLKRMGLVCIDNSVRKRPIYTIFELKYMRGYLVNYRLKDHSKAIQKASGGIDYDGLQKVNKNKAAIDKIKNDMRGDYVVMTREELAALMNSKKPA